VSLITAPSRLDVADVLDKAADHIDTHGWTQGRLYDGRQADGGTPIAECRSDLYGALKTAVIGVPRWGGTPEQVALTDAAYQAVEDHLHTDNVHGWNDEPERVQADVTTALRATATNLRGEATA
jgi:hypothetical protein